MIGLNDPHENLKHKLRIMSDKALIEFGKAAGERCKESQNQEAWVELKLAREEWRSRHPRRRREQKTSSGTEFVGQLGS